MRQRTALLRYRGIDHIPGQKLARALKRRIDQSFRQQALARRANVRKLKALLMEVLA